MAQGNVAPKADQPRVTTQSLKRSDSAPAMQYKTTGIKSFSRGSNKNYGRATRG
jgi:hypothetical protein